MLRFDGELAEMAPRVYPLVYKNSKELGRAKLRSACQHVRSFPEAFHRTSPRFRSNPYDIVFTYTTTGRKFNLDVSSSTRFKAMFEMVAHRPGLGTAELKF